MNFEGEMYGVVDGLFAINVKDWKFFDDFFIHYSNAKIVLFLVYTA